jgi:hypothetical protein
MPIAKLKYLVVNGDVATGNFAPCIKLTALQAPIAILSVCVCT